MHDDKQESILASKEEQKQEATMQLLANNTQLQEHETVVTEIG